MRHIKLIVFVFWGFGLIPFIAAGQFTETKEIVKQFKVTPETQIEITNKYGKIDLNSWENDSVYVEIKVRVEEKKLSKLEKAIEEIDFDFTQSSHYLIINTLVDQNKSSFGKEISKFKETVLPSDGNIRIDISVWVPADNRLKVENKFGDIYIGDYNGDVEINLSNGNLKSHNFAGELNLTLSFADATINTLKTAQMNCNFSDIYIKKAELLNVKSKSTNFEIVDVKTIDAVSRRDNFRIQKVEMIEAQGSFSNFRIEELTDRVNLKMEYGDLDIDNTVADFSSIFIESKSTDINLSFDGQSVFNFEITHTKTDLDFCREIEIEERRSLDEKEKRMKLIGNFGGLSKNNTRLNIKAISGEINIFAK